MRGCQHCGTDLDALGKRSHARYCTAVHRAAASRKRRAATKAAEKAHRKRTRKARDDLRVPYGRLVAHLGKSAARELLTERQRAAVERRETGT